MTTTCECGALRGIGARSCGGCAWRDGHNRTEARLIGGLRALGERATVEALALETGLCARQVLRGLKVLLDRGRVVKQVAGEEVAWGAQLGEPIAATFVLIDRGRARRCAPVVLNRRAA